MKLDLPRIGVIESTSVHIVRGYRSLGFDFQGAGRLGACRFDRVQIEARETRPWSGEVNVSARRFIARPDTGQPCYMPQGDWVGITDKAHDLLVRQTAPQFAGERFAVEWEKAWRAKHTAAAADNCRAASAAAMRIAAWWMAAAELHEQYAAGTLQLVRVRPPEGERWPTVDVPPSSHDVSYVEVSGRLEYPDGELAGWMGVDGRLVPAGVRLR